MHTGDAPTSGAPGEAAGLTDPKLPAYDPISSRAFHRVSAIYAVDTSPDAAAEAPGIPICDSLRFDRLDRSFRASQGQFPVVVGRWAIDEFEFELAPCGAISGRLWLVRLPNQTLVAVVTVETECQQAELIALLEDLHHRRIKLDGQPVWEALTARAPAPLRDAMSGLGIETYNLVHLDERLWEEVRPAGQVNVQLVSSLIYRFDEPYSSLSDRIRLPAESNRGAAFAATGPYVGVTVRTQGYVENAILVSCLLFVGALATLRQVRDEAYRELIRARTFLAAAHDLSPRATRTQRVLLSISAQRLARLQLDLSAGVEAFERVASTVPSLRVTDFHEDLFDSASITEETRTVGAILERLGAALRAETERRHAAERRVDERRSIARSVAFGVITAIALPLGIVFGFFGVNATEVEPSRSLTDVSFYWVFYLALGSVLLVAGLIALILHLTFRIERTRERRQIKEAVGS